MDAIEKAKELVRDAYYDERGMADVMRSDAAIWAAIAAAEAAQAQAEQLKRIAVSLEAIGHALEAANAYESILA